MECMRSVKKSRKVVRISAWVHWLCIDYLNIIYYTYALEIVYGDNAQEFTDNLLIQAHYKVQSTMILHTANDDTVQQIIHDTTFLTR